MKRIFSAFLFFFIIVSLFGQSNNGCVDSTRIRYGFSCPPDYQPECGCDGKTYRNSCFLQNNAILSYITGICEEIGIDFNPNPASDVVFFDLILKREGDVNFYIFDHYGRLFLHNIYNKIERKTFSLDLNNYRLGVYFVLAQTGESYVIKKLVKTEN